MADRNKANDGGLPEQAAQSPEEAAATPNTPPPAVGAEPGSTTSATTLATAGYTGRVVHPDHPDVVLTPKGPVDASGNRTQLTTEQAKAFIDAAPRYSVELREIPA
jgi:hypothetical protein